MITTFFYQAAANATLRRMQIHLPVILPRHCRQVESAGHHDCHSKANPQIQPSPLAPVESANPESAHLPHVWIQTGTVTTTRSMRNLVTEVSSHGIKRFFCGWKGCDRLVGFAHKPQLVTHIRSVHLQEKPFQCVTWFVPHLLVVRHGA